MLNINDYSWAPASFVLALGLLPITGLKSTEANHVEGGLITFNDNGAWCWYQDPRVVVDTVNNTLIITSIAAAEGVDGDKRVGDVDLVTYHLNSGKTDRFILKHNLLEQDDHNAAALLIRPDGRYLAMYSRHNKDAYHYWRVSIHPHDTSEWGPELTFDWLPYLNAFNQRNHVTYTNLFHLSAENRTYNFSRAINCDPTILISTDHGNSWSFGGKLLTEKLVGYVNSYTKYASNGIDRIDFLSTEHHPRDFDNNIYHGYIKGDALHNSTGNIIDDNVFNGQDHTQKLLTKVFATGLIVEEDVMSHAWTICLHVDALGHPYGLISCRANDIPQNTNFNDHRFFYVRFDGNTWQVHHLAKAGACLWPDEEDYTGIGDVDPADPNIVYISTTIDPHDGKPLNVHEIFKGITTDGGATWTWTSITRDSSVDNLRPICVSWNDGNSAVLWFRGTMSRSQHYNCAIVGIIMKKQLYPCSSKYY